MSQPRTLDALLLIGVRLLVSSAVWWSGFRAVSDDDYARVVIAQKFASAPALDPSGTSWLPFPFWLQGSAMGLFGAELGTAIGVAWASGVACTLLVWLAARTLGLARGAALTAAILASAIPYSAWLGVATVPELLTAGFVIYGIATLAVPGVTGVTGVPAVSAGVTHSAGHSAGHSARQRCWGALALCCATLSRYETWPVAALFALFCVLDVIHARGRGREVSALAASAFLASAGMLLWLLHGIANHGNATFFVERVANYQKALGGHDFDAFTALLRHPGFMVKHAPALIGLTILGAVLALLRRRSPALFSLVAQQVGPGVWGRPLLACGSLVVFLIVGDLRGAGATHHPARTLLPVWFLACIIVAALATPSGGPRDPKTRDPKTRDPKTQRVRDPKTRDPKSRAQLSYLAAALVVASIVIVDGWHNRVLDGPRQFVDRSDELGIGEHARLIRDGMHNTARAAGGRVLIAAEDYGYFAMIAAIADPARVEVFDDHDPRHALPRHARPRHARPRHALQGDSLERQRALQQPLASDSISVLIAPRSLALLRSGGLPRGFRSVPTTSTKYALFAAAPSAL